MVKQQTHIRKKSIAGKGKKVKLVGKVVRYKNKRYIVLRELQKDVFIIRDIENGNIIQNVQRYQLIN